MCVRVCVRVCVAPGVLWVVALYVAVLSHPFKRQRLACHTHTPSHTYIHTHTHIQTRGAFPVTSLYSQKTQMWQQINVGWPRITRTYTHTHTHTEHGHSMGFHWLSAHMQKHREQGICQSLHTHTPASTVLIQQSTETTAML